MGEPPFSWRGAKEPFLIGADGRRYVDYVGSWGPLILGHAYPAVVSAAIEAVTRGTTFGAPTELEVRFAERVRLVRVPRDGARRVERHRGDHVRAAGSARVYRA